MKQKKYVEKEYFTESQRFWHKVIMDRINWIKIDIIEEQKKATAIFVVTAAITTALCTMMCAFVNHFPNKR